VLINLQEELTNIWHFLDDKYTGQWQLFGLSTSNSYCGRKNIIIFFTLKYISIQDGDN
jgi:hypothetical protein